MANNHSNGRKCKDWLTSYCEYTSEQESPSMFHLWVGISVVASTLARRCYIDRGYYRLFPNLYIVLVGGSARVRKTTAINIGYNIFKDAHPDSTLISQKITPEAMLGVLTGSETDSSGGTIISDELSVFLGNTAKDDSLIQLLTKLYDCGDVMDYHTLGRGKEIATNVYMNMIAGTTPEWIRTAIPTHAIGGGFTSRIIFVYQFEPEKLIPFPALTTAQVRLQGQLVDDLKVIGLMNGKYTLSEKARGWYEEWYCNIFGKMTEKTESVLDGYYGRKHDTLLKVAMSMAASHTNMMVIDEKDLETALLAMNENEKYLPEVIKSVMSTQVGDEQNKVLRCIQKRGEVSYSDLLKNVSYCMDARRVCEIIDTLIAEELISESVKDGKRYFRGRKNGGKK